VTTSWGSLLGSGTLVSPYWVLTAAHVVEDPTISLATVSWGQDVRYSAQEILYPGWTGDAQGGNDLALVRLTQPVDTLVPAEIYTGEDEIERVGTVVGYGRTGTGLTGAVRPAGTKRAGRNLIGGLGTVIGYSENTLLADFDVPDPDATGKAICLDLEYLAAWGDSGGGWFAQIDSQTYLVGVTSFLYAMDGDLDADYGDIMGSTRVSVFADWIEFYITPHPGDANSDGLVSIADLSILAGNWYQPVEGYHHGDFNADGVVSIGDLAVLAAYWGWERSTQAPAPEPGAAGLLLLGGGIGLLKRRFWF